MEKEIIVTKEASFFDYSEFEAFLFWKKFSSITRRIKELADNVLRNKRNIPIAQNNFYKIDAELDSIKKLFLESYQLVLNTDPSHTECVEASDNNDDHLAALYFWSMDYQKEIECVVNILSKTPFHLEDKIVDKRLQPQVENVFNSMHTLFSLVYNAMCMPIQLLGQFDLFLNDFLKSEYRERKVSAWRKDYVLPLEQLLSRLKEIKSFQPWVDKCRLLYEGKIEKRELFVDKTIRGVQHNAEMNKTNSWLSIFTIMAILKEYDECQSQKILPKSTFSAELFESEYWKKLKEAGWVDEDGQPTCSRTEAAILADELLEKMKKGHKWTIFEKMWNRKNMRTDFQEAMKLVKYDKVRKKIVKILG